MVLDGFEHPEKAPDTNNVHLYLLGLQEGKEGKRAAMRVNPEWNLTDVQPHPEFAPDVEKSALAYDAKKGVLDMNNRNATHAHLHVRTTGYRAKVRES